MVHPGLPGRLVTQCSRLRHIALECSRVVPTRAAHEIELFFLRIGARNLVQIRKLIWALYAALDT